MARVLIEPALTDWVRGVTDQLAEHGYIAIAPDLLSGMGPGGGKTSDFSDSNAARDALYKLSPEQVTEDLNASFDYVSKLPACNKKVAIAGFCWGGSQTFRFATNQPTLAAAFVFYGRKPRDKASLKRIDCPVYGFYVGNDARVTATIPETEEFMKDARQTPSARARPRWPRFRTWRAVGLGIRPADPRMAL